ncbi:enoyl-CoA hydratase-related protein [Phytohabitans sp. ZYX-F-186]|uniref:Enoyl-CoA hydratase-related protein n=1 Tax=Phytohabitans maris TaxID=3071409 RepID=A0ABU0ZK65_9ACTN|nr:enoyl-CoA hydratase-related protein [Phytohabitans sp. ZYX-F-186]MDQ7907451.1 enoyl-CoA hydratase-related protein [Phytohabitans sp. ZYX-F-186]
MSAVRLEVLDGVAVVELSRPDRGNAVDLRLAQSLHEVVTHVATLPDVAVAVLTGAGERFCVGGDLRAMAAAPEPRAYLGELARAAHRAVLALRALPVPVVAAVQGACAGAGLGFALACDVVLAERTARFVTAYTAAGLSPDSGLSWILPRLVGPRRAAELVLTNRTLSADEALAWGLLGSVVEPGEARRAAVDLARRLAAGPDTALANSVRLLRDAFDHSLETQLDREAAAIADAAGSPSGVEGIAAFAAKRPADFVRHRRPRAAEAVDPGRTEPPEPVRRWHEMMRDRDLSPVTPILAESVEFRSPAVRAPQRGREATTRYLAAALAVLGDAIGYRRTWLAADSAVLEFAAVLEGVEIQGVDILRWNGDGRIEEITVLVRPHKALRYLIDAMAAQLGG